MDNRLKFSEQVAMLNHLKTKKLITTMEYNISIFVTGGDGYELP